MGMEREIVEVRRKIVEKLGVKEFDAFLVARLMTHI
jgi:hypothetical protein